MDDYGDISSDLPPRMPKRAMLHRMSSQSSPDLTKLSNNDHVLEGLAESSTCPKFNLKNTQYETKQDDMDQTAPLRQRRLSTSASALNLQPADVQPLTKQPSLLDRLIHGGFVCDDFKTPPNNNIKKQSLLSRFAELGPAANWLVRKPLPDTESEIFRQIAMDKW